MTLRGGIRRVRRGVRRVRVNLWLDDVNNWIAYRMGFVAGVKARGAGDLSEAQIEAMASGAYEALRK